MENILKYKIGQVRKNKVLFVSQKKRIMNFLIMCMYLYIYHIQSPITLIVETKAKECIVDFRFILEKKDNTGYIIDYEYHVILIILIFF